MPMQPLPLLQVKGGYRVGARVEPFHLQSVVLGRAASAALATTAVTMLLPADGYAVSGWITANLAPARAGFGPAPVVHHRHLDQITDHRVGGGATAARVEAAGVRGGVRRPPAHRAVAPGGVGAAAARVVDDGDATGGGPGGVAPGGKRVGVAGCQAVPRRGGRAAGAPGPGAAVGPAAVDVVQGQAAFRDGEALRLVLDQRLDVGARRLPEHGGTAAVGRGGRPRRDADAGGTGDRGRAQGHLGTAGSSDEEVVPGAETHR